MQGSNNKNASLISIYCPRQKIRVNSISQVITNQMSSKNLSGQRLQTEQNRRIKSMRSQRFQLQYKSENREQIKFSNCNKLSSSNSRKQSNYNSHVNTSTSDPEDKAFVIQKIIFSAKSPQQSLRLQAILNKKSYNNDLNRRKTLRNSLFTNSYKNQNILMTGNECGWSRKSSESLLFL